MANDSARTCPGHMVGNGFHPVFPHPCGIKWMGLADTAVITAYSIVKDDTNGALTNGAASMTAALFQGVSLIACGSATASANASTLCPVLIVRSDMFFWAKVGTGTANATSVGLVVDFTNSYSIDLNTGSSAGEVGFKTYAYDTTNAMMLGTFIYL